MVPIRAIAVLVFIVMCVVGCAAVESSDDQDISTQESHDQGSLKTYFSQEVLSINAAVMEATYQCYGRHGYPQFIEVLEAQKISQFTTLPSTSDFTSVFAELKREPWFESEDDARTRGYGRSTPDVAASVYVRDASFRDVAGVCASDVEEIYPGSAAALGDYVALGHRLAQFLQAVTDRNWDEETQKVLACMAGKNFPVIPDGLNRSPTWDMDFGVPLGSEPELDFPKVQSDEPVQISPAIPGKPYKPTPQEAESAVTMYLCSIETGARMTWTKAMTEAEGSAVEANRTELEAWRPKILALAVSISEKTKTNRLL
jgi:hypothetical protein